MNKYIEILTKLAQKAAKKGDVPVSAIIVQNGKILSKAYNQKEKNNNAVLHAEILAISKACKKKKSWHLDDCEIYCTMEPCMMCCGAIIQSRIKKVYYLLKNEKFGCTEMLKNSKIECVEMNNDNKMLEILNDFFKNKR